MRITLGKPLKLSEIPFASARLPGAAFGIATDSREIRKGDLFLAYTGKHHRGISFSEQAMASGAVAVLTEESAAGEQVISVPSLTDVLASLARSYLNQACAKRIAVTGSVGKTTTVAAIATILGKRLTVHAPSGNYNTDIGLPLTVLSMPPSAEALVLEMGARRAGEIGHLSRIVQPHVGVITGIGSSHLETFGTKKAILSAKTEIACGMNDSSILLLNSDDAMLSEYQGACPLRTVSVSPSRSIFAPELMQMNRPLRYAAAFAAEIALQMGFPAEEVKASVFNLRLPPMRLEMIERDDVLYLMDAYNASPESAYAALEELYTYRSKGKDLFCLFSDMRELGADEKLLHREVGRASAKSGLTHLFCYGRLAKEIGIGALRAGMKETQISFFEFGGEDALIESIREHLSPNSVLLLKGSRETRLENVLNRLS